MATNFQKISDKYDINPEKYWGDAGDTRYMYEGEAPCFVYRAELHQDMTASEIDKYLRSAQRQTIGVVILSTTEQESNHKAIIAAAKLIKGATVTRGRSTNHGGYPCWLIALPGTAKN